MKKLYRVSSVIDNVIYEQKTFDKVIFNWFFSGRKEIGISYEDLVINYKKLSDKAKKNGEKFINELFTKEEALILKSELDRNSSGETTIEEIKLPVPDHMEPYSMLKSENGKGFSNLSARESYDLPFQVIGFFNIHDSYEAQKGDENPTEVTTLPDNFFKEKK